jgi:LPXTG-site transpeptidase (sortase) family protein
MARLRLVLPGLRVPFTLIASAAVIAATVITGSAPAAVPERHPVEAIVPTPTPVPVFVPERVVIPALQVNAPTVPVGTEADGSMGTPSTAYQIAWWEGVKVGAGNALLAGHSDWNGAPGAFQQLGDLKPGDPVIVTGQGQSLTFRVTWVQLLSGGIDATQILGPQGSPVVTLITCGGVFDTSIGHHLSRYVVRGVLAA